MPDRRNGDMGIRNRDELKEKINGILNSAKVTLDKLDKITADNFIFEGKFGQLGTKLTDSSTPEDLGEQIQQSMTVLMTCYAVDWLTENTDFNYPFETSEAANNGADIYKEKSVTCEVFAAKNPKNNKKIYHDLNAVAMKPQKNKYVFYCSPADKKIIPKKNEHHSSKIYNFDFEIKDIDQSNPELSVIKISSKDYTAVTVTLIHITPCCLHQWINKIVPSGISGLSQEN